jgi:transposase-like protein
VNRFQFVADHQARYGVKRLCRIVGVARSSFYYWRSTAADRAAREAADAALAVRIRAVQTAVPHLRCKRAKRSSVGPT